MPNLIFFSLFLYLFTFKFCKPVPASSSHFSLSPLIFSSTFKLTLKKCSYPHLFDPF
jgi:hypothetical protein